MDAHEAAIRSQIATWLTATHEGDVDAVLQLMAPDVVFLVAGQAPMQGRAAFAHGLENLLATHTVDAHSTIDEVVVEGTMAYSRTTLTVTVQPKVGTAGVTRHGSTLSVWRRDSKGQWLLARDANLLGGAASG